MHIVPELGYEYNALEPYIDAKTMEIHHTKHHQTYVDKLNKAVEGSDIKDLDIDTLMRDIDKIPEELKTAVRNHGGGHLNHSFFWPLLKKNTQASGALRKAVEVEFGSIDDFKQQFSESAVTVFGSGWAWLVVKDAKLHITTTKNQDSPVSAGMHPVVGLDVWEHAYYLKYQNKRPEYIKAFFDVLNWEQANKNYEQIMTEVNK